MLRKLVRFAIINILSFIRKKRVSGKWFGQMCLFSIFQALGTLWDFHLENHFQSFIGRESNWPISCLNDSETQERGALGVKIQKISQWSMPLDPRIGLRLWRSLRKLVRLSIYPTFAPVLLTLLTKYSWFNKGCFYSLWELAIGHWQCSPKDLGKAMQHSDKILIYSKSCCSVYSAVMDNLPCTWEFSLVFHVISLKVSLNLWLTVPFNEKSGQYCDRFHGRVNELIPYQLREKTMKKH